MWEARRRALEMDELERKSKSAEAQLLLRQMDMVSSNGTVVVFVCGVGGEAARGPKYAV